MSTFGYGRYLMQIQGPGWPKSVTVGHEICVWYINIGFINNIFWSKFESFFQIIISNGSDQVYELRFLENTTNLLNFVTELKIYWSQKKVTQILEFDEIICFFLINFLLS